MDHFHGMPLLERVHQIELGIVSKGDEVLNSNRRVAIKMGQYDVELLEEEREAKRLRYGMSDREDDADDIMSLMAHLGMALVKVWALSATVNSMRAEGDGAQSMCAGSKGRIEEFISCADVYKKKMNKAWDGKDYMEYARYATLLRHFQEDCDGVRVGTVTNEFEDLYQWQDNNH